MKNFLCNLLGVMLVFLNQTALAEDIDLYVQPQMTSVDLPNILIILDNTANWSTPFTNEIAALRSTLQGLSIASDGSPKFKLGMMLYAETGSPNNNISGGYIRAAIRPMTADTKAKYVDIVNLFNVLNDKGNAGVSSLAMAEAYRYFTSGIPYAGNGKAKTDYTGNICSDCNITTESKTAFAAVTALGQNALSSKDGTAYNSPIGSGCANNFIIFISNGANQDATATITEATSMLSTAGGDATPIAISPDGSMGNVTDEWARFMNKSSLGVVTYTIDIDKVTTGQGPGWTALLKSMASVSTGKYFDVSSGNGGAQISAALNTIFSEIQSINNVFASVSLPVSVNTQGSYLNQLYFGMFRPDGNALPRWMGNLKQYKLGLIGDEVKMLDADDNPAVNLSTGFITECARSFWTPSATDTYWSFNPQGKCTEIASSDVSNYPDGSIVEKGGQAYLLRSSVTRNLKTCSSTFSSCTSLADFTSSNVTSTLGAATVSERDTLGLINWQRGLDIRNENNNSLTSGEMRPSVHADVLHSRPVAINFGNDDSPQVVVFYGGNDGILRAVNGNRSGSINGVNAGGELWSFVAPEFFPQVKRLYDNTTQINFFGLTSATPTPLPKPYGFDGSISAYRDASRTWVYAPMRRGGRVLYAFDFSSLSSPALKWKKGCPNQADDTGCSTGFSGIGQTWSTAKPLKAGYNSGATPLLIMGGGYDPCEDADPHSCTATAKGRYIYVLDGDTGELLKTFTTERPVVADVFVIPDRKTGMAKWAYIADLGGNLYRISGANANAAFESTPPADWTMTQIASLGCGSAAESCSPNRKFMFTPDVIEDNGSYLLLLGSGDREKPLVGYDSAYATANMFYILRDQPTDSAWLASENEGCGDSLICQASLSPLSESTPPLSPDSANSKGWYLGLSPGEQVVTSAITIYGTAIFSTHTPNAPVAGACSSNLGSSRVYEIDLTGEAGTGSNLVQTDLITGGGLPPSPVVGRVKLDNGKLVTVVIGASPDSIFEPRLLPEPQPPKRPKGRVYWYIQK